MAAGWTSFLQGKMQAEHHLVQPYQCPQPHPINWLQIQKSNQMLIENIYLMAIYNSNVKN